jgi:RNA polymerase sigma-70 factor (ECF subfamily)
MFKQLFSDYYSPLCLFAAKYLIDMEVSKDLVQDVFVKLWERNVKITSGQSVKSFLYVSVRNACLNYLRKQENESLYKKDYSELKSDSIFEYDMLEEDVCYRLYKAVDELSPRSRKAIMLTIQEYSNNEIAEIMKVSINTVKTLKQRSYRRLKHSLIGLTVLILSSF